MSGSVRLLEPPRAASTYGGAVDETAAPPADSADRSVWLKAGLLVGAVAVGIVVLVVVVGRRTPTMKPDSLIEQMADKYGVDVSRPEAECMIGAGYGNYADLSGLACLRGENRRYFADLLWRQVAPVPASQAAVDCFSAWAVGDEVSTRLREIGAAAKSVDAAGEQAVDYIRREGAGPCAAG